MTPITQEQQPWRLSIDAGALPLSDMRSRTGEARRASCGQEAFRACVQPPNLLSIDLETGGDGGCGAAMRDVHDSSRLVLLAVSRQLTIVVDPLTAAPAPVWFLRRAPSRTRLPSVAALAFHDNQRRLDAAWDDRFRD